MGAGNAWCCALNRLQLCFGRHTGYGGYGDWARGSRIVRLVRSLPTAGAPDGTAGAARGPGAVLVETWVRMEDGSVNSFQIFGRPATV
jgi:hypothetical protein